LRGVSLGTTVLIGTPQGFEIEPSVRLYTIWDVVRPHGQPRQPQSEQNFFDGRASAGANVSVDVDRHHEAHTLYGIYADYYFTSTATTRRCRSHRCCCPPSSCRAGRRVTGGVGLTLATGATLCVGAEVRAVRSCEVSDNGPVGA